ncbi:MAG: hypothetical protein OEV30_03220 [Ignavibacteria bacterium]|nr:hypothetical protein [Ignavibacteria bacterium]
MSWVLGLVSDNLTTALRKKVSSVHSSPLHTYSDSHTHLIAGGLPSTLLFDGTAGPCPLVVLGCGIRSRAGCASGMDAHHWRAIIAGRESDVRDIDGHFLVISPRGREVYCWSDSLGLRRLYSIRRDEGTFFSSRIDLLAKLAGGLSLSPRKFGGHWLTFNQMSFEGFHEGVIRTGPGSTMILSADNVRVNHRLFSPGNISVEPDVFTDLLKQYLAFEPAGGKKMAFGLSGGLDSRLLLSLLLPQKERFYLYSLGNEAEPDCTVARSIANDLSLEQVMLGEEVPSADICLDRLRRYAARTYAFSPASSFHKLGVFGRLHERGSYVVDGGMGEIVRRQFLNRLRVRGRRYLENARPSEIFRHMQVPVPDIFKQEVIREMRAGALEDIGTAMQRLPPGCSHDDILDTLIVRYRYPNYAGIEQSRMDEEVLSLTPFCQASVVNSAFGLSASHKRGARLFRRLIRSGSPQLASYPLVKGGSRYPFSLSPISSWVWTGVQKRIGRSYEDPTRDIVLKKLGPYVRDQVRAGAVRSYELYDYPSILQCVDSYYEGDETKGSFVDRWLSFEIWRQMTGGSGD